MAGQGVNMGFSDVQCLVNILEQAVQNGADFSMKWVFVRLGFV
jgi:2-polyprenyl-6-methoxyphenol hydroxylase-like FAD-dependent oxidoreductase